ncbi:MAG: hypothetical protein ACREMY_18285 [bacterium]
MTTRMTFAIVLSWMVGVACGFGLALLLDSGTHGSVTIGKPV